MGFADMLIKLNMSYNSKKAVDFSEKIMKSELLFSIMKKVKTPEDLLLELIQTLPKFDAEAAWREVKEERRKERS